MTVVVGMNEIDSRFSGTTLFNTVVVIGPLGTLLNRHRKLMPTNPERMVWGMGDASGLESSIHPPVGWRPRSAGRASCHWRGMPSMRRGLRSSSNPTWDNGEACLVTLRHIAREAGCWVIGTATALQGSDVPADFPERDRLYKPDEWINDGELWWSIRPATSSLGQSIAKKAFFTPRSIVKRHGGRAAHWTSAATMPGRIFFAFGEPQTTPAGGILGLMEHGAMRLAVATLRTGN